MRYISIEKFGGPEVLQLAEGPAPTPQAGQVRIRVAAAGVNRPDCVQRLGLYPPPAGASPVLGLEVSGVIDQVGAGVSRWREGDAVCALLTGGGYADYAIADEGLVLPVPNSLSLLEAAGVCEVYFTVWSNLFQRAYASEGETLLVHGGSSGIGSAAIQLAKAYSLQVVTTVGSADKAAFARSMGADHVINYRTHDFASEVKTLYPEGVDVVIDMVGGDYIARNISVMAAGGRHVSLAFLSGPKATLNMMPVMLKRLTLTGSTLRARSNQFKAAIAGELEALVWPLFSDQSLRVPVDSCFGLSEASAAHARMEASQHMGKILLKVAPEL